MSKSQETVATQYVLEAENSRDVLPTVDFVLINIQEVNLVHHDALLNCQDH